MAYKHPLPPFNVVAQFQRHPRTSLWMSLTEAAAYLGLSRWGTHVKLRVHRVPVVAFPREKLWVRRDYLDPLKEGTRASV